MSDETAYRTETDSMGEVSVPQDALYGAQTQRAIENFPISDRRFGRRFIWAIGLIKRCGAEVNVDLGLVETDVGEAIAAASEEVAEGRHDDQFPLDIFQTGSGTSTHMNANEVIANRAIELTGGRKGSKEIHPNDDVNTCQASNDAIPTAIHAATVAAIDEDLLPALRELRDALAAKAEAFDDVVKTGRTHLQDAVPIRLGQEFSGYASQIDHGIERVEATRDDLLELPLGGTAVGTGMNVHPEFAERVVDLLAEETGQAFRVPDNRFEAIANRDSLVWTSGALKMVAASVMKIANDLRWLSSGPRTGLREITLPAVQPGSSFMPGKINPVIPESACQVAGQVIGNDLAVTVGGQAGNLDLNVMQPMMADNVWQSIDLLANVSETLVERCIEDIEANEAVCRDNAEKTPAVATALAPHVGYDEASKIAKRAVDENKTIKEVATERTDLTAEELDEILDLREMTEPGIY